MDAMALLCTLHADGPATLKSLRQAGCASLEAVVSMGEERLSKILGTPAAAARRFAREARHLKERLGAGSLDREETSVDAAAVAEAPATEPAVQNFRAPESAPAATDPVEVALAAWRARDLAEVEDEPENEESAEEVSAEAEDLEARPARARPEFEFGTELVAAMREIADPAPAIAPQVLGALTAGEVDGLDEGLCRQLAEIEIRSLTDLAMTDPLELARVSGLGYTHAWRLHCLARRAILAEPEPSPSLVLVPYKVSLSEVPRQEDPSILELEWNRELRPTPPPPRSSEPVVPSPAAERESAGGPFA